MAQGIVVAFCDVLLHSGLVLYHIRKVKILHLSLEDPFLLSLVLYLVLKLLHFLLKFLLLPFADCSRHCRLSLCLVQSIVQMLDLLFKVIYFYFVSFTLIYEHAYLVSLAITINPSLLLSCTRGALFPRIHRLPSRSCLRCMVMWRELPNRETVIVNLHGGPFSRGRLGRVVVVVVVTTAAVFIASLRHLGGSFRRFDFVRSRFID